MARHVLLTRVELFGEVLHGGLAALVEVIDDPDPQRLAESMQPVRDECDQRIGNRPWEHHHETFGLRVGVGASRDREGRLIAGLAQTRLSDEL